MHSNGLSPEFWRNLCSINAFSNPRCQFLLSMKFKRGNSKLNTHLTSILLTHSFDFNTSNAEPSSIKYLQFYFEFIIYTYLPISFRFCNLYFLFFLPLNFDQIANRLLSGCILNMIRPCRYLMIFMILLDSTLLNDSHD